MINLASKLELKLIPVVQVFIVAVLMWFSHFLLPQSKLLSEFRWQGSSAFILIGLIFGISAVVHFRRQQTTVNPSQPQNASQLVTTGIFSLSRNPMYVGLMCLLLAWGWWLSSIWQLIWVAVFMLYMTRFQIIPEERALKTLFGDEYQQYCARVRRWL